MIDWLVCVCVCGGGGGGGGGGYLLTHPNITAFHSMMLFSVGAPLTPAGGSCCNLATERHILRLTPLVCLTIGFTARV